jgi:hypothetical protein
MIIFFLLHTISEKKEKNIVYDTDFIRADKMRISGGCESESGRQYFCVFIHSNEQPQIIVSEKKMGRV